MGAAASARHGLALLQPWSWQPEPVLEHQPRKTAASASRPPRLGSSEGYGLDPLRTGCRAAAVVLGLAAGRSRPHRCRTRSPALTLTEAPVSQTTSWEDKRPWLQRYLPDEPGPGNSAEDLREKFFQAVKDKGLQLYDAQEEAIAELFNDSHVFLSTPTGSGKSLVATAMLFRAVALGHRAYYTCPIKALVSEKFFDLCRAFGPELVGMATGDVSINPDAPLICCTAEVLASISLRDGPEAPLQHAVMDEFHYFGDKSRGYAWEVPLLRLPHVRFLLMSATMGDNPQLYESLERRTKRAVRVVTSSDRPVPLDWSYEFLKVGEVIRALVKEERAPVYVVSFTQRDAADLAASLLSNSEISVTKEQKQQLLEAVEGVGFDSPYGPTIRNLLINGIGLHHAGLLPKYRLLVERLSQTGRLLCICGTDTLGVGVNVPIRSVLFTQLCKYNGETTQILSARDFHQIAGRAGRRGYDTRGSVVAVPPEHEVDNVRLKEKAAQQKREGKIKLETPPLRNYVKWDEKTFEHLSQAKPEPLQSRFQLSQGAVLSVLQGAQEFDRPGLSEIEDLVATSYCDAEQKLDQSMQVGRYIEALERSTLIQQEGDKIRVDPSLQQDFFLLEDASLFLIDVLPLLQWQFGSSDEAYSVAVLAVVEALCEDPKAALQAQSKEVRADRKRLLGERGIIIEEEMRQQGVGLLKQLCGGAEAVDAFDDFLRSHPWISKNALQPKAIALDMYLAQQNFSDYVTSLAVNDKSKVVVRQEGLLLRYFMQVHKTLRHNVPEEFKTDGLLEIEAFLLSTINETDSSLIREWEALKVLEQQRVQDLQDLEQLLTVTEGIGDVEAPAEPPETEYELRAFHARVRQEALQLARCIASGRWPFLRQRLRPSSVAKWSEERLKAARAAACGSARCCEERGGQQVVELDDSLTGVSAKVHVYSLKQGGKGPDRSKVAVELEVFAPWSKNSFEPILDLIKVGSGTD